MPQLSWKTSWSARLWQQMPPQKAALLLAQNYGARAREEALLRGHLAERYGEVETAHFWVSVFQQLKPYSPS